MKKTWFKFFMGLFVLLFAGVWIAGGVAEARSKGMKKREEHRHHSPYNVEVGDVVAIAGGGSHTIELKADGTVWAWGSNELGQLGDGTTIDSPAPIQVSGLTDITAIAGGDSHSIALKIDGTVWAWGYNGAGQLGNGTTIDSATPVQVSGLTDVTAIAAGGSHTLALKADGTVWAWGYNSSGQLGVETTEECEFGSMDRTCSTTPVQVSGLTDVIAIAAGSTYYTLALKTDGTVWAWGYNNWGLGTTENTPEQVVSLTDVTAIAAGRGHILALKTDGTVWAWGSNNAGQLGDGTMTSSATPVQVSWLSDVTAIAAAGGNFAMGHSIALKADGTVWAWGYNRYGQLGITTETCDIYVYLGRNSYGFSAFCSSTPVQVSGLTDVAAIAAGGSHTLALKTYGTVWTWGDNYYGQLGAITTGLCDYEDYFDCSNTPVPVRSKATGTFSVGGTVSGLTGTLVLQNNGGDDLIITENGPFTFATELEDLAIYDIEILTQPDGQTCEIMSSNSERINATDKTDIQIICPYPLTEAVDIAAGGGHSIALKDDGTVWAWGWNGFGQLGNGTRTNSNTTPLEISELTDIVAVAAGSYHSIALKAGGTVWAWGSNKYGQLGDGTITDSTTPVQVSGITDVTAIEAGGEHSLALKSDGTVWAWGYNRYGQLGDGTTRNSTTPVQISSLTDVTAIAAGGAHTLALKSDGTIWACGRNYYGQLGDGTTIDSTTPVQVSGLTDVTAITGGYDHTLALKTDGTVWAWGYNRYGQLGDGTTNSSTTPVQVSELTDVTAIVAGRSHSIALKTDGTVLAWGGNYAGQLGDGTIDSSSTPVQVSELTDITEIAAGEYHSITLNTDSAVQAWGRNYYGQLGDGTTDSSSIPVQVLERP